MNPLELIEELRENGVRLWLDGDQLVYEGSAAALTPSSIEKMTRHKSEIVCLIRAQQELQALPDLIAQPRHGRLPLSLAQERLWFLEQLGLVGSAYTLAGAMRIRGTLQVQALRQSFDDLVQRHESLRTRFEAQEGQSWQVIDQDGGFDLELKDLSDLDELPREQKVEEICREVMHRTFDIRKGPLLRAMLIKCAEQDHRVIVSMHHVISDGWSTGVLQSELGLLYKARIEGRAMPLEPLQVQYADYALWQRGWLQGDLLERQVAYWKDKLAGAPQQLDIPTDRIRPAVQDFSGSSVTLDLTPARTQALSQLAREHRVTMFMVLLAAFQLVLGRWSGQQDVVVGTPIAGRTHKKTEGLIGFFVNALPLRTQLHGNPTFVELLAQVKETVLGAYGHQNVPFEKLVEILQPARDLSRAAGFQALIALQNLPPVAIARLDGVEMDRQPLELVSAKLDLSLYLHEIDGGLQGYLEYATSLFERTTVESVAHAFQQVLDAVIEDPHQRVEHLPLVNAASSQSHVLQWRGQSPQDGGAQTLHAAFARQARLTPDAPAVKSSTEQLSFAQLEARANQLACHLREHAVKEESTIGICVDRSAGMVVALLAIWKAGMAFMPLDPKLPPARIKYLLDDSGTGTILIGGKSARTLEFGARRVIDLERHAEDIARYSSDPLPALTTSPDSSAYVIYTSGSTGAPKGVLGTHRALFSRVVCERVAEDDVFINKTTLNFIDALWELFVPLTRGMCVRLLEESSQDDIDAYVDELRASEVTRLVLVPSLLSAFMASPRFAELQTLRECVCSGEALSLALATQFSELHPRVRLVNTYGATEFWDATSGEAGAGSHAKVSIGSSLPHVRCYLLDVAFRRVPQGAVGELFIAGAGLAQGYLGRPDLTAERFLPDPWVAGARMYRTGDFARQRADGSFEFIGRRDDLVKLRGHRIELNEVASALEALAGVSKAAVLLDDRVPGNEQLVGFAERAPDASLDSDHLSEQLRAVLPATHLPARIMVSDRLARTPSGKIDRVALLSALAKAPLKQSITAARTTTEVMLADMWQEVLRVPRISATDSFFAVGGHSLQAMRLISRIRDITGVELSLRQFFETPSIEKLAVVINQGAGEEVKALPDLVVQPRDEQVPLSMAQERLWFLEQLGLVGSAYTLSRAMRIRGPLQVEALRLSFGDLVRRHESLRTRFEAHESHVQQVVDEDGGFELELRDITELDALLREKEVLQITNKPVHRPFDISTGPLLRGEVVKIASEDHLVIVSMHHIISDGWSMGVLQKELGLLYQARIEGRPMPLEPLPVQYADYALWQRGWLQGDLLEEQLGYWKEKLAGAPPLLDIPTDRIRPAVQDFRGASAELGLTREQTQALEQLAREHRVTLFMVLLAAFQTVLGRWSGQQDVVVGTPIAGRTHKKTEGLIGFFMNTLPLRTQLGGNPTFAQLLVQVKETVLGAYAHQDVPFEKLVKVVQPARNLARAPVVQVLINSLAHARPSIEDFPSELDIERVYQKGEDSKFDMTLFVGEEIDQLSFSLVYAAELFDHESMEALLGQLREVLLEVAENAATPIDYLRLAPAREADPLALAAVQPRVTSTETLLQRLSRWADQYAELPALTDGSLVLSFAQLQAFSHRLARWALAQGLKRGDKVAIVGRRCAQLPVIVLALQRIGVAVCIVDPSHPESRIVDSVAKAAVKAWIALRPEARTLEEAATDGGAAWLQLPDAVLSNPAALGDHDAAPLPEADAMTPEDLAYMVFTSGTTGEPKLVGSRLAALTHFLEWQRDTFELTRFDRFALFAGLAHDPVYRDLFAPLWCGGHLEIPPIDAPDFKAVDWVEKAGLTVVHWTPSFAESICVKAGSETSLLSKAFLAGEELTLRHAQMLQRYAPNCEVVNFYGTTETPQAMAFSRVSIDELVKRKPALGQGIDGVWLEVTREDGTPAAIGESGEIRIHTPFLAVGYLNDAKLTAERFVPSPYGPGVRAYRTGDLGRQRFDGEIAYLGRGDLQVKYRGYRIELSVIEHEISRFPQIAQVAVRVRNEADGAPQLVAYFVERQDLRDSWIASSSDESDDGLIADASSNANPSMIALKAALQCSSDLGQSIEGRTLQGARAPGRSAPAIHQPARDLVQTPEALEQAARAGRPVVLPLSCCGVDALHDWVARYRALTSQGGHADLVDAVALLAFAHANTSRATARAQAQASLAAVQADAALPLDTHAVMGSASDCALLLSRLKHAGVDLVLLVEPGDGTSEAQHESREVLREAMRLGRQMALVDDIRAQLNRTLGYSMSPTRYVGLQALPLTPNHKLDEYGLPAPSRALVTGVPGYVAPRSPYERELASIWSELLGVNEVGVHDNFFDIGGHSLLLNQVVARLRRVTGVDAPLRMLFEAPTIAEFVPHYEALVMQQTGAATLEETGGEFQLEETNSPLTLMQLGDSSITFLFHALDGGLTVYDPLLEELGWDNTVYGFDALASLEYAGDTDSIEEMARGYVEEMRKLQEVGPYHLVGWSFGGLLAYECARQLRRQGCEVALLALIDSRLSDDSAAMVDEFDVWKSFIGYLTHEVKVFAGYDVSELLTAAPEDRIAEVVRHVRQIGNATWTATFTEERVLQQYEVFRRNLGALHAYRPEAYDGRIVHFETVDQDEGVTCVWLSLASAGCDRVLVSGDHTSVMRRPHIGLIAEFLGPLIAGEALQGEPAVYVRLENAEEQRG